MNKEYDVVGISSPGDALKDVAKNEGVRTLSVRMSRSISPFLDLKALIQLYRIIKSEKPIIVHTHTPKAGTLGMIASKLAGVPYRLHTVAGMPLLEVTGVKRKVLNVVERLTYSCASHIYPNSRGLQEIIITNRLAPVSKLKVIGDGSSNGIDTSFFDPSHFSVEDNSKLRASLDFADSDFVFVFVGRLVKDKGINELVEAFCLLNAIVKNTKLLLVGPLEQELDPLKPETLLRIQNTKNILSVGLQADVRPFFAVADALVFPSYREGFPNVVLQAGAMGLPSIVTDINGCNEIIVERENGLIIPVKSSEALYQSMLEIKSDDNLRRCMAKKSREMIMTRFEQVVLWRRILEEYKNLK